LPSVSTSEEATIMRALRFAGTGALDNPDVARMDRPVPLAGESGNPDEGFTILGDRSDL
jgi:hypothetical protein